MISIRVIVIYTFVRYNVLFQTLVTYIYRTFCRFLKVYILFF